MSGFHDVMIIREIMDYNAFHFTIVPFIESHLVGLFLFTVLSECFTIQYELWI